jgi:hypothetical protein
MKPIGGMDSDNLIHAINEKYGGHYTEDPEKVGYSPEGVIKKQLSYSTFAYREHTVRVVCDDDDIRWNPYKVIIYVKEAPASPIHIFPRSYLGALFHKFDLQPLHRKYRFQLDPKLYAGIQKSYTLEASLLEHTLAIHSSSRADSPSLLLTSEESVLDVETLEKHIEIGIQLAEILERIRI